GPRAVGGAARGERGGVGARRSPARWREPHRIVATGEWLLERRHARRQRGADVGAPGEHEVGHPDVTRKLLRGDGGAAALGQAEGRDLAEDRERLGVATAEDDGGREQEDGAGAGGVSAPWLRRCARSPW